MERFLGPVVFGISGWLFGLWALRADLRRMGLAAPRQTSSREHVRPIPGGLRIALWALAALATWAAFGRRGTLTLVLAGIGLRVVENHRRMKRQQDLRREWPFLIESMAVATLSGMGPGEAFQAAAKRARGAMREETEKVVLRLLGGAGLSKALKTMEGCGLPDVRRLRALLSQSKILGTPVADMLKKLSDEGYEEDRRAMEERFNALPIKLSAITVFFLLPPVLAVSVIPHILAFIEAGW
ncbi:MAG: type II secretion system F family protein [Firmicutes bacterium]|nr:type II secretion system F family protein [Candidatus Fermentithermobacillaceae bacterium]